CRRYILVIAESRRTDFCRQESGRRSAPLRTDEGRRIARVARAEPGVGPQYPIESVDNALRLILLFRDRRSVRVSDAAKELGVAPSTAHRLLAMLVHHGFVAQDSETRMYTPGSSLIDLGVAMLDLSDLRTTAWPYMAELAAKVDETVSLGMLRDRIVIF